MSSQAPSQSENQQNENSNSDDMARLYQEVLKKRSLIIVEEDQLKPLLEYCLDYKQQCLEEEKYLLARDANELAESIKEEMQYRKEDQSANQSSTADESTETTKKISEFDQKIQEHDEQTKVKIQNLQKKQQDELEEFEKEWREVMPDKYRRPSKQLIELRQQAHTLGYAGKFEEANERQIEAKNLMQREHEQAKRKLDRDYEIAKNKFIKKQNEAMSILQQTCQQQRELLVSKKQITEQALEKRKLVLGSKPPQKQKSRSSSSIQNSAPSNSLNQTTSSNTQNRNTRKSSNFNPEERLPPIEPPNQKRNQTRKNISPKPLSQQSSFKENGSAPRTSTSPKLSPKSPTSQKPVQSEDQNPVQPEVSNPVQSEVQNSNSTPVGQENEGDANNQATLDNILTDQVNQIVDDVNKQ